MSGRVFRPGELVVLHEVETDYITRSIVPRKREMGIAIVIGVTASDEDVYDVWASFGTGYGFAKDDSRTMRFRWHRNGLRHASEVWNFASRADGEHCSHFIESDAI